MKERLSVVETKIGQIQVKLEGVKEKTDSSHKRIDDANTEVNSLRVRTHDHANIIQRHGGILVGIETAVKDFAESAKEQNKKTTENTNKLRDLTTRADMIITLGCVFFSFCGFVGGKLLHWW